MGSAQLPKIPMNLYFPNLCGIFAVVSRPN